MGERCPKCGSVFTDFVVSCVPKNDGTFMAIENSRHHCIVCGHVWPEEEPTPDAGKHVEILLQTDEGAWVDLTAPYTLDDKPDVYEVCDDHAMDAFRYITRDSHFNAPCSREPLSELPPLKSYGSYGMEIRTTYSSALRDLMWSLRRLVKLAVRDIRRKLGR
jgi:ribosomal protein S27AE